ncbi:MAG TPA: AbgT family transporter [Phycisphaerales bacterium]|nr:AbgT family transporter [Phycisphaerales bacterium]HMP36398.1 AbgT family transporter [Phycisphaerales bacterium]
MSKATDPPAGVPQPTGFRFLDLVERIGNRLPDPVTLFMVGALSVLVGSAIAAHLGWSMTYLARTADGSLAEQTVVARSLLAGEDFRWVWTNLVTNFTGFPPLGVVLVCMLGIGVAERTGLLAAALKLLVTVTPVAALTPMMIFAGILSNVASDAGYIVLPPLAALIFAKVGRAPLVGLAAVFAGVAAGFSANLVPSSLDPLLQGLTQSAAGIIDQGHRVNILCNYYFMIVSTFVLTLTGWAVTRWIVEPRFSAAEIALQKASLAEGGADLSDDRVSPAEKRGLLAALATLLVAGAGYFALVLMPSSPLSGTFIKNNLEVPVWPDTVVPAMFILFFLPGITYGIAARTIRTDRDVAGMMGRTMSTMGMYVVLAFFAAQFVAWFDRSNLGRLTALTGADLLQSMDLPPLGLVAAIILLVGFLNLFLGSASAKWALIAPVLVPMFMRLGISPELSQAAYRVGDSATNPIAPLNPYLVVVLVYVQRCVPKAGLGTLISLMLPYSLVFLIVWTILLVGYVGLGFALGPETTAWVEVPR